MRIFNRVEEGGKYSHLLSGATVSLFDSNNNIVDTQRIGNVTGIAEFNITFLEGFSTMLTDSCKDQIRAKFELNQTYILDSSIALVFGNKTTVGQVCSFAKGLASNTVTKLPGFCCLDAPYQSNMEEWGEKVSSWDARMKEDRTAMSQRS